MPEDGTQFAARQRETKRATLFREPHLPNAASSHPIVTTICDGVEQHLKQGPQASLQPALELGRQAVALGLETLELARIHEQALVTLELSNTKNALTKLAGIFFTEANTPIEETHRAARQTKVDLSQRDGHAGPAHGGTGRHQPPIAAGRRPAQGHGG